MNDKQAERRKALKSYLNQYASLSRRVEYEREQIERMRAIVEAGRMAGLPTGMPRGSAGGSWTDVIDRAIALEEKHARREAELLKLQSDIEALADNLTNEREQAVIRYRYISAWKWDRIAEKMSYDVSNVHRIHGHALHHLLKFYDPS